MSIVDHHGEVEYPFSQKTVFKAIMEAAPHMNGLSLDSADEMSGRVTFKAGVSLVSWGETIPVQLIKVSSARTQMKVMSTPKTGVMFGGAMDFGKNQQNIDKIINAVSNVLASYPPEKETLQNVDMVEQLTRLKQLVDQGILTEEYNEQKRKILDGGMISLQPANNESSKETFINEQPIGIEGSNGGNASNYAIIALFVFVVVFLLMILASCTHQPENSSGVADVEKKYQDSISVLKNQLKQANAQIEVLKFPADQRLNHIVELYNSQEYDKARKEIAELERVFPNAKENADARKYLEKIKAIEAATKAEEERIKALGFKAFSDTPSVTLDKVTYSFSGFTYGRTFTFEYVYDVDEYSYEVADKNCTYILASLTISTKEDYASTPTVYACEIVNGKLKEIDDFRIEYASYKTYGASIGNYSEISHDFSKVSSVKYKMAAQIPQSYTSKPIVIIVKKGSGYLSGELSVNDVKQDYTVIKILNRKRL